MAQVCTYIDGIGTSEALDSSGEVVSLKGIDTSSLVGAPFNYEHKSDFPAQIVGKILESIKIFSKEDCKNDRHLYYWNKCQIPFLYVMGRLFDDRQPSAKEVAAIFQDDAAHPNENPMLGFSVEGARLGEKQGMVVPRSIARKITITVANANKTCAAGIIPEKKPTETGDLESIFKGEMEIFKFEESYTDILAKKEDFKKDELSNTKMKVAAAKLESKAPGYTTRAITQAKKPSISGTQPQGFTFKKSMTAGSGMAAPSQLEGGAALASEDLDKKKMHKNEWKTAPTGVQHMSHPSGSRFEIPSQGAGPTKLQHYDAKGGMTTYSPFKSPEHAKAHAEGLLGKSESLEKKEKSHWYEQAEQAYDTWDKKNHFKDYMKKRMPHLADGEVDAIGKCLALKKARKAENALSKMYANQAVKSRKKE